MKYTICLLLFVLLLFSGCCTSKRLRTTTRVETITKIDTFLIVKRDTVPVIKTGTVHDTIFLENSTARVVAYYDLLKEKYVVKLTGKPFEVKFKIDQRTITLTKIKNIEKENKLIIPIFTGLFMMLLFIVFYLLYKQK
jgi:hypothetical protein